MCKRTRTHSRSLEEGECLNLWGWGRWGLASLSSLSFPASGVAQRLVSGADWRSEKGCGQLSGPVQLEPRLPGRPLDAKGPDPPTGGFEATLSSSA